MKPLLIISLLCLFTFAKCKKDKPEGNTIYFGSGQVQLNGGILAFNKLRGGLFNNNPDSLGVILEKWDGLVLKETISIGPLSKSLNVQQRIYKGIYGAGNRLTSNYSTLRDDGDVLCDFYFINDPDSVSNHVVVTSYNPETKEIRGTFEVTYVIDPVRTKCRQSAPDTIKIRNGQFHTKIF